MFCIVVGSLVDSISADGSLSRCVGVFVCEPLIERCSYETAGEFMDEYVHQKIVIGIAARPHARTLAAGLTIASLLNNWSRLACSAVADLARLVHCFLIE